MAQAIHHSIKPCLRIALEQISSATLSAGLGFRREDRVPASSKSSFASHLSDADPQLCAIKLG